MSFADDVREELCDLPIKKPCCQRAFAMGLLLPAREEADKAFSVRYKHETVATLASAMIRRQFGKAPESEMRGACGHRYYDLFFSSPALKKMHRQLRASDDGAEEALHFSCEGCGASFLRGAFLSTGTLNDPHKSFHLEFLLPDEGSANALSVILSRLGYPPRRIVRKNGVGVYYKDGGSVEDLVALMGAQHTIFEIINSRIERDIRNNENRATNCVAKNIEKTISAATRQIEAINRLLEHDRLERLPEPLRVTAMVRYRNPDATLDELVRIHEPPISKSGLNHRLEKLIAEAEELS